MQIGFIIPTELESQNLNEYNSHLTCAGYGAGKVSACSAAASLIFDKKCDTIIIWGLAGGLSDKVNVNDIVVAEKVAYRDYNIEPLMDSTGIGYTPGFAEKDLWVSLDEDLNDLLNKSLAKIFLERNIVSGNICTGDQFIHHSSKITYNRIEQNADAVDMESAAVVHFCNNLNKFSGMNLKVGIVRVISDNTDHNAHVDFGKFLEEFSEMNPQLFSLRKEILMETWSEKQIFDEIKDYPDFPTKGVLFKDIWGVIKDQRIFDKVCHKMYDLFNIEHNQVKITKVAGIESRGFLFGYEIAKMMKVPFVPVRKAGKLPGEVSSEEYTTEYSSTKLEVQKDSFSPNDSVLLVDDVLATGGSLIAAKKAIERSGARCRHCLVFGEIGSLKGERAVRDSGMFFTSLLNF